MQAAVWCLVKSVSTSSPDKSERMSFNASSTLPETYAMRFTATKICERQRRLSSGSDEHDTDRIRYHEVHALKRGRCTIPHLGIHTR